MKALALDFGVQFLQGIQDEDFRMLLFLADPGDTGIIVCPCGCRKWKFQMIVRVLIGRIRIFDGKRSRKAGQGFFLDGQTVLVKFSLVKKQGNTVICDSYPVRVIGFHMGKPFMCNHILLFEIMDKVIHGVLEGKKLALRQPGFGDIEINKGHNKKYGDGRPGA